MSSFDELVNAISAKAKACGYKKSRLTWYKDKDKLTVVLSIERSQYDPKLWYYNYGICLHEQSNGKHHSLRACQIRYRVDCTSNGVTLDSGAVLSLLEKWESMYGDIGLLRICAVQGKLPLQTSLDAIRYLTSVDVSAL